MVFGWTVAEAVGGGLQATHNSEQSTQRGLNIVPDPIMRAIGQGIG